MTDVVALSTSTPEAQGIRSSAIISFVDAVEREIRDLHSIILVRHGVVVAEGYWEPYGPSYPHMLFSLSKSFTSTAIGLLVADGRLSVDDPVLDLFPDAAPADPSENLRAMRVRHLLTMTTGHDVEPLGRLRESEASWVRGFLAWPVEHPPGTHFVYNSLATYMLSAIVQRLTGQRLLDYLEPRVFKPLGIANATWEQSTEGIDVGGWGLSITTRDIARFGQLYLQRGVWQGRRLIPEEWVTEATSRQVPNGPSENPDWEQGYGYQFWRCRHGAYRGDGAFGQFCVVMPEQEAVLAITAGTSTMQAVLDLVWEHLLAAMESAPVPADARLQQTLAERLATLRLTPARGQPGSPLAAAISGREFVLEKAVGPIAAIGFDFVDGGGILTLRSAEHEEQIHCGDSRWVRGESALLRAYGRAPGAGAARIAASGAWTDDQTYLVEICWYETPFRHSLICHFEGDRVLIDPQVNVGFGPTELPRVEGRSTRSSSLRNGR
jgi:CubicO group peptidase (beta-lactamase class C family)